MEQNEYIVVNKIILETTSTNGEKKNLIFELKDGIVKQDDFVIQLNEKEKKFLIDGKFESYNFNMEERK